MADERGQSNVIANLEAEEAVLGSILLDNSVFVGVAAVLSDKDFWLETNQWIFQAMTRLDQKSAPIDMITLNDELDSAGVMEEIGGPGKIVDLLTHTPTALYADHYAKIVKDRATLRELTMAAQKIAGMAYDTDPDVDVIGVLDNAESLLARVTAGSMNGSIYSLGDSLQIALENIDDAQRNPGVLVNTGYSMLDRILNGLRPGDMIVVAGRPGMGKSAFAINVARQVCKDGKRVALFSLEMSKDQIAQRFLAMESGVMADAIRSANLTEADWDELMKAANRLNKLPLFMDDTSGITLSEIRAKCRRLLPLDLIMIDYMQLMSSSHGNKTTTREQEVSHISRNMKALAREFNCPVIAMSQLSRNPEGRTNKRPMLSDLRESGSIEQDADMVLMLYREDYYEEDSDSANIVEVNTAKNRNGSTGTISLYFRKELGQLRDLEIHRSELKY